MKKLLTLILITIISTNMMCAQDRLTGKTFATRSEIIAKHGMAATSQPLATQVALDILKKVEMLSMLLLLLMQHWV